MAQICTPDCQMSPIVHLYLEMVQVDHLDNEANLSGALQCKTCLKNECAVDGNGGSFKKASECQVIIQSLGDRTIIRPETVAPTRKAACMSHSTSDKTTVYYYKSNVLGNLGKGAPVILKISDSDQFLKCQSINGRAVLDVECCDEGKLKYFSENDPITWPFVFYLSVMKDNCRRFESAECPGWFIRTEPKHVYMDEQKDKDSGKYSFYFFSSPKSESESKSK
ncbi:uncharacterized protein Hap1MRO34_004193 [Clarias gariepinus]|uniref:uncharacterized protein LOC128519506 n=1 Tax=Clarias gariepinus TaxID=13013 RepID=UPI00234DF84F|nr:uncharacterized protein LOC128519506 [Clarias gariepinus]